MEIILKHLLNIDTEFNFQSLSDVSKLANSSGLVTLFVGIFSLLFIFIILKLLLLRSKLKASYSTLEIKPLRTTSTSPISTQQLFTVIHSLASQLPLWKKLIGISKNYSFEIHSSKTKGIQYFIRVPDSDTVLIKQHLLSYLPGISVSVNQNTPEVAISSVTNYKLSNHYAYPLKNHIELLDHDPLAYITGALAKPSADEHLIFQMVVSPTKNNLNPAHLQAISETNKDLFQQIQRKSTQSLFKTAIRLSVSGTANPHNRRHNLTSALASLSNGTFQSLSPIKYFNFSTLNNFLLSHRLLNPFNNAILSVNEISDLYHFPTSIKGKTEDLQKQHAKQLPAPTSLKQSQNLDIIFAKNVYGGSVTDIGISLEERRRHMYILGATGTGKSTLLHTMIHQDLQNGKGLAVLDPHGDLIENILELIPDERIKDVVYFNPDDIGYPVGINLLELTPDLEGDDALREKEFIAESIISLFHKIYTEKFSGPRMEYILRNTIHTAFEVENATLFTVYKLLINAKYRNSVVRKLKDENLIDFWKYEFAKAGDYQKVKMISPITNKIGRFLFSPTAKRILQQPKSTINFDDILDNGKILLCNLSKGKIGEDNSEVFGIVMMTKIQLAALKRARQSMENRRDFFLYVDEFQNFATPAFAQILSEARKYRLNAILAHQTTSQLSNSDLVNVTLANTGTVVCFRTANPEDEKRILPQFAPYVELGEISSLPSYTFYMRLSALKPEEPFSGETVPVEIIPNKKKVSRIIASSRKRYAIKYVEPFKEEPSKPKKSTKKKAKPKPQEKDMK